MRRPRPRRESNKAPRRQPTIDSYKAPVVSGRAARPGLKLGICGEHGGDPESIRFCRDVGLDYVSCSPYRVPIARLAAAQAELTGEAGGSTA